MLEFSSISVKKGSAEILKDVSFAVPDRAVTVLLGKNGSGKSTLLDTVTGSVRFKGSVTLDGTDLRSLSPKERAKKVVYLPQKLTDSGISLRSLISLGRISSMGAFHSLTDTDRSAIENALKICGISSLSSRTVSSLSGGERQRAYVAMVLASDAEYLIFDEPTTYLDIGAAREILHLISDLVKHHGKTVLLVLHDLNSAVSVADHVCVLASGRSIFSGSTEAFCNSDLPFDVFCAECVRVNGKAVFI